MHYSTVWQVLTATPFSWEKWWPQLDDLRTLDVHDDYVGTRFSCVWRAPTGYKLRCVFETLAATYPSRMSFGATGDLIGTASWSYRQQQSGATIVDIIWEVETTKWWMNLFAPLLKPVFTRSHDQVMASGEHGLNAYLAEQKISGN